MTNLFPASTLAIREEAFHPPNSAIQAASILGRGTGLVRDGAGALGGLVNEDRAVALRATRGRSFRPGERRSLEAYGVRRQPVFERFDLQFGLARRPVGEAGSQRASEQAAGKRGVVPHAS